MTYSIVEPSQFLTAEVFRQDEFMDGLARHDWEQYRGRKVLVRGCGGNCACSTCHIIVESGFERLSAITDDEAEMLEEVDGLTDRSHLSCRCIVTDDLVVRIPGPGTF